MSQRLTKPILFLSFSFLFLVFLGIKTQAQNQTSDQNTFEEAKSLFGKGTGESFQQALEKFQLAAKFFKESGNKLEQGQCLIYSGVIADGLGLKNQSVEFYEESIPIFQEIKENYWSALAFNNAGKVLTFLGQQTKAQTYFEKALLLWRVIPEKNGEASTLNNIGLLYYNSGEKQKALGFYNQALLLYQEAKNIGGELTTLTNIGAAFSDLGEKKIALSYYQRALPIWRSIPDKNGEASTLNNQGSVFSDLGEYQKAIDNFQQALTIYHDLGDKNGEARTLSNLGKSFERLGNYVKALDFYNKSLPLFNQSNDKIGEARTFDNIGGVYDEGHDYLKALEYYKKAVELDKQNGQDEGRAVTLGNIGILYSRIGNKEMAADYFRQALMLLKFVENKTGEAQILKGSLYLWDGLGKKKLATFYGKLSINLYQNLRTSAKNLDSATQKGFLNTIKDSYRYLADVLIQTKNFDLALQTLNLYQDQQFYDLSFNKNGSKKSIAFSSREEKFANRYEETLTKFRQTSLQLNELKRKVAETKLTLVETAQLQDLEFKLKSATDSFTAFLKDAEIEFSKPFDKQDKVRNIPDVPEMQATLRNLNKLTKKKTVAIYTLVGETNFQALIVSPNKIKAVTIPIKGIKLNEKAKQFWGLLQSDKYDTTLLSKQIYDVVFKPLEGELPKDTTTIMWNLDENLRYIPIAALFDGKKFLAERYQNVVFTRSDKVRLTRVISPNWTGTGFGTSQAQTVDLYGDGDKIPFVDLPGVTQELQSIFANQNGNQVKNRGILKGEVLLDDQFTKDNFYRALKQHSPVVHISSHFQFRPGDESRSFLLLGDGSPLTLSELKKQTNLFQGVDLLTLSACNTAATQADANGKEIDGFAELAQRLGAGAVMATLWQVSDASTPWLMRGFYEKRQSKKLTKAEALQKAQQALINGTAETNPISEATKGTANTVKVEVTENGEASPADQTRGAEVIYVPSKSAPLYKKDPNKPFAHPFYWSPFVLYGNWR